MKKTVRVRQVIQLLILAAFMVVGYSNCGGSMHSGGMEESSSTSSSICEPDLMKAYVQSYRVMFLKPGQCVSCHADSGPAPVKFAATDIKMAFNTFMAVGVPTIDARAVDTAHAPGVTSPQLQSQINEAHTIWDPAYSTYASCMATNGGQNASASDDVTGDSISLAQKNLPMIYFGTSAEQINQRYEWNLSGTDALPFAKRVAAVFSVGIRIRYVNGLATGYILSSPSLRMDTGESEFEVEGLNVRINGVRINGLDQLASARRTFRGIAPAALFNGEVIVPVAKVSTADKFSFGFAYSVVRTRTDNPPTPATPTLTLNPARTNQTTANFTITATGALRWCVTTESRRPNSTAEACPGFENNLTVADKGWLRTQPNSFLMTSAGMALAAGSVQNVPLYVWVANSDLKINAAPGTATVVYDSQNPAVQAPGFDVITTSTQVVNLAIGDATETVDWCVMATASSQAPTPSRECFDQTGRTKPRFSGFTGPNGDNVAGNQFFWLFLRDLAGNTARYVAPPLPGPPVVNDPPLMRRNPYGAISLTQLSNSSFGPRAVFANSCVSCHSAGGSGAAVTLGNGNANQILSVSLNGHRAALNVNMTALPEASRELVRLWVNQGARQ